ncbi:hypothetical protein SASPL_148645 [Salvia splendens]|uniref:F-box associated beta-propeller type 3 domain-containing protein n=1 Tax=Salvia splendens TaxID=180675 RepID=A0A8X8W9G1_SALSN|nr:hypothetical protein SASPL_148645 [Salvia splendens]
MPSARPSTSSPLCSCRWHTRALAGSMTSRLATSAMRCLSLRRGVRSSIYISAAEARFVRRNLEEIDPRQLKPWDIERELAKPPEDGTISPYYDICLPSFLKENYYLSGATCNGLLHLHNANLGHALWNPTTDCACLDGVFYCKAFKNGVSGPVFCSFDLSTETMSTLPFPELSESEFKIIKYKGMLSVVEWLDDKDDVPWKFQLWSLKDGSWTRESAFHTRGIRQMLWFSPDGKLLYFASLNDELVVFDRSIGMLKHIGVKWFSSKPKIIPFVESFAQLNGISHVEETHEQKKEEKDEAAYDVSLN